MRPLLLLPYYIHWHYGPALRNGVRITTNFVWFCWHLFSIGILLHTLFAPWQKLHESRKEGFSLTDLMATITMNIIIRMIGAVIRTVMIVMGFICIILVLSFSAIGFVVWLAFPVILILCIAVAIKFMVQPL